MSDPAQSLFCRGTELQFDNAQREREEEEEAREEAARLDAQLKQKLEGAFDDLDFDDDDDDSRLFSPPGVNKYNGFAGATVTPGTDTQQLKYLTSTPYDQGSIPSHPSHDQELQFQQMATPYQNFHQLPVEETNFETPFVGRNNVPISEEMKTNHVQFDDDLNKSDSEKVLAQKIGIGFKSNDLETMYHARGKQIGLLENQLSENKSEFEKQLRQIRHELALTKAEAQSSGNNEEQLRKVLSDSKRENKVLTDEIHGLNTKVQLLTLTNENLSREAEGNVVVVSQLQSQLAELQNNDTVLRARQQHDATVRTMIERHNKEISNVREEADKASATASKLEIDIFTLKEKLASAETERDIATKARLEEVTELGNKLSAAIRNNDSSYLRDELQQLKAQLLIEQKERSKEESERRKFEGQVEQLKVEIGALEALQGSHSDSMIQMGLNGVDSVSVGGNQRVRDELHRSLVGNKTKREEISRLESNLRSQEVEIEELKRREGDLINQVSHLRTELNVTKDSASTNQNLVKENERNANLLVNLKEELEQLEKENVQLKKHVSDMIEENDADKQEAIDELREDYEAQLNRAVEETKSLMEGEVKRLRIELDVYSKTLIEIRNNYASLEDKNNAYMTTIEDLEKQIIDKENKYKESATQNEELVKKDHLETIRNSVRDELEKEFQAKSTVHEKEIVRKLEDQFEARELALKSDLREMWNLESKLKVEEAVAAARLQWIKQLPEAEKKGGAVRESLGELERNRELLNKERCLRETMESALREHELKIQTLTSNERELQRDLENKKREGVREAEEKLGIEMREALIKQQQQWEKIVRDTREEAEEQRKLVARQWETQTEQVEVKLKKIIGEKASIVNKEREAVLVADQWKRTAEERKQVIEKLKDMERGKNEDLIRKTNDLKLLKEEAERRAHEIERQREEMSSMVIKWQKDMESIQESHTKERKDLEDITEKYHKLKSKVRKYKEHVEAKEDHHKAEYTRLENEFRNTLEKLRERMEVAYNNKEKQVENELGNMFEQLSTELRKAVSENKEQEKVSGNEAGSIMDQLSNRVEQRLADFNHKFDQPVKLTNAHVRNERHNNLQ